MDCKIWEAARATSAMPALFKSIEIGREQHFVNGGVGCHNPSHMMDCEAEALFGPRQIGCFVSIGAGQARVFSLQKPPGLWQRLLQPTKNVIKALLMEIAIDSENTHRHMLYLFKSLPNIYFRLNVKWEAQGLRIKLSEWEEVGNVEARTREYLGRREVNEQLALLMKVMSPEPPYSDQVAYTM